MNCFVIMPFARTFDDVYGVIRNSMVLAFPERAGQCRRLDEIKPAGRITERLLQELQSATLCIADMTGNNPNVMWEVGYAMALGKPLLMIGQNLAEIPFDLKDMLCIQYDRSHLGETLGRPLVQALQDTVERTATTPQREDVLLHLKDQVGDLKTMLGQLVRSWGPDQFGNYPDQSPTADDKSLADLEGAWLGRESETHLYAKLTNGQLLVPYCYGGNDWLTGFYYGWERIGEYWFARFRWLRINVSGFAFLKLETPDVLTGAWWHDSEPIEGPQGPPKGAGVPLRLERIQGVPLPSWAWEFIEEPRRVGKLCRLTLASTGQNRAGRDSAG
jgi:hypothetical protein